MTEQLDQFMVKFDEVVSECERLCYAARARELQEAAVKALNDVKSKASALKAIMVQDCDEDSANQLLSYECMIKALINDLKMWIAFKDDDPISAWSALVYAQNSARTAMQAHAIANHLDPYIQRLYVLEELLFPPQIFSSPGTIIKRSTCSICGSNYGQCNHIKGKPYMGEICARVIEECELREISLVKNPANKLARMSTIVIKGIGYKLRI